MQLKVIHVAQEITVHDVSNQSGFERSLPSIVTIIWGDNGSRYCVE